MTAPASTAVAEPDLIVRREGAAGIILDDLLPEFPENGGD